MVSKDLHGFKKMLKQLNIQFYQNPNTVLYLAISKEEI